MKLTYPWFLLALLAIAIPIAIHLLQLRRPHRLLFTNTAFIREVDLVTVRHRKVQHLFILLARVLAVATMVLVFCKPFIPAAQSVKEANSSVLDVLVDNTFSMQLQGAAQGSLFQGAISQAGRLGNLESASGRLKLMNSGNGLVTQAAYKNKLDELKLTSRNPYYKIDEAAEAQTESKNSLFILSDFQKDSFNPKLLAKINPAQNVVLVPLVGKKVGNLYVDSVWLDDAFVRVRTNIGLHVRVRNGGLAVANDSPVKVFLGNRQVAAFRVTVEPGQAAASVVQVQLNDNALALGRVVTEDTPVTFDNTFYFTLQPAAAIRVLEIGPEPVAQQLYGNEPLFTYSYSKPQSVNYAAMRQANLVILREVEAIDAGLREGLREVVKRGGNVVVVPSASPAAHNSYQQLFKDLGLGTAQWENVTGTPELRDVAMPSAREPFFRDVFGAQQRAVTMPRVAPVLRWTRTGTDILRLRDGESYLADFPTGAGRVYVFSAPFSKEYSDFTAHALFVPVMYRMAMLSYRNEQFPAYSLTQPTVTLQLPTTNNELARPNGAADEAGFRLVKDSLTFIPAQRVLGQEVRLELPEGMDSPGFYQVQRQGKPITTLAFNMDKRESELAAYSADDLRKMVGNRPNIRVLEAGESGADLAKFQAQQTGQPLWRYFLALALMCLLAEALLIRYGTRRAVVRVKVAA
ncbi:BatA domain-containing protein [Hymenobacter sp. BT770]|uniref:BatA domain-containing protein n=1 Tax=Hymenobacter sp. BT770 TaxID=2886942 RepID=UPI001D12CA7B|nr:BatA domain-containing protein [Hymenobacter sp. BT770]MCC3154709.1 BatA domain-containing protein [Hymenobacter sp. BT770]MDO3416763.1 BatA domain-containing protein [Hymenobacter sp. BT770]